MLSNKGFTLIEVLIASTVVFVIITTIVPIVMLIEYERNVLRTRLTYTHLLHDELQPYLWETDQKLPHTYTKKIQLNEVTFHFSKNNHLVKGCVQWQNVKQTNEKMCLYGRPKQ
ncbi:MAG TPA: prepilin-type N-terminal cleavage/methylation domain-containing protein [Bacillota bacterium]